MKKFLVTMGLVAFAFVGCDDSSSASVGPNDEPAVESSSSSSGKVTEPAEVTSSSSSVDTISSSSLQGDKNSSSSGQNETSSSSVTSAGSATLSSSSAGALNCSALLEGKRGWSWDVPKECRLNPEISYGTMTDSRDGKKYKTVTIGDQVWMAENLNYADSVTTTSLKGKSWCYNNVAKNCDVGGRLYTWGAAKTACPSGWHLPTSAEFETLFTAVGGSSTSGTKLKSTSGWNEYKGESGNGTDAFGFSALPAGGRDGYEDYYYEGYYADFWSSTEDGSDDAYLEDGSDSAYFMRLYYSYDYARLGDYSKYYGFSVRCLKD